MTTHTSPGLRFSPLIEYLAALGLGKILAQQVDASARFGWADGVFTVEAEIDDVAAFLVEDYVPTPVFSPWSGGSGFGEKDKASRRYVEQIEASTTPRLAPFRETLAVVRRILRAAPEPGKAQWPKDRLVQELRNWLPDEALGWLDAAVILTSSGASYPPILGTGGNDGRLDFSTNFHQRLANVLPELGATPAKSRGWATDMLEHTGTTPLISSAIGQMDPAAAGGPGSSIHGSADSVVNPWLYILMIEGAMLFAASTAKRFGEQTGRAAMPFTVASSPDGPTPGAADEEARGELWAPILERVTLPHLVQILNEARVAWDGATAGTAAAMYGALHTHGVDRGIQGFQRFGFLKRNGLSFVAVPLDTLRVENRPEVAAAVHPMRRARVFERASGAATAVAKRRFSRTATEFLRDPSGLGAMRMLKAQTVLEIAATRSHSNRENLARPGRLAPADAVLPAVQTVLNSSAEARVAAGIASALAPAPPAAGQRSAAVTIRDLLIGPDPGREVREAVVTGLGARPLIDVLADLMVWLAQHPGEDPRVERGWLPWLRHRYRTGWADIHAWMGGVLDDRLVEEHLLAFLSVDWASRHRATADPALRHRSEPCHADPTLAMLQALASGRALLGEAPIDTDRWRQGLLPSWPLLLRADHVAEVHRAASGVVARSQLLPQGGSANPGEPLALITHPDLHPAPPAGSGPRILAALTAPASTSALRHIAPSPITTQKVTEGEPS